MSAPEIDVLVVGGGPAGSVTAALLAGRGWSVRILERAVHPRPKPCGECLSPGAVAALGRTGFLDVVLALGPARLGGWEVRTGGGARAQGAFPSDAPTGLGAPRERMDRALLSEALRRGADVEDGVRVLRVPPPDDDGRTLSVRDAAGEPGVRRARFVVGADGLRSVVARQVGAHARAPRLRKLSLSARVRGRPDAPADRGVVWISDEATVGLAPVSDDGSLWNLTVVVDAARHGRAAAGRRAELHLELAARAPFRWTEGPDVVGGPWASGPFDWPARAVVADRLVLVGDAAGYFDPLTGQGIYRAIRSAELAAETIDTALRRGRLSGVALRPYAVRHRNAFASGVRVQRLIEGVVSRPPLREAVLERLGARPAAFDALLAVTGDRAPARSLTRPALLAALLLPPKG